MKVHIHELMNNIEDSSVNIEEQNVVSSERIKELTRMKIHNSNTKRNSSKKGIVTLGIAVAVVAALGVTAFAAFGGGLDGILFNKAADEQAPIAESDIKTSDDYFAYAGNQEYISLQGYTDSPEYTAAKEWRLDAAAMKEAIRSSCMNEDGLLTDGPATADLSQHAQVFGVLSGTLTEEEGCNAIRRCMTEPGFARCTVAMNWYLFRALEKTGLYHLTDRCWDVWRRMIANGCTTCVESEGYNRSECHAWGSLILYELPSVTLGVRPASPGYGTVEVVPVPGYLDHAEGTVHTPRGDVRVEWYRSGSGIKCHVEADKGIHFSSNSVLR